ncbi:DNA repair protein [Legionella israelensis]|uniref:Nickel/cobalt efflux system n=1 Tax=Legionella israelensis TaxID=454 RepID=A0AAX1EIA2_9GAMM|nr:DNA repair protein [Legionella israelensis]QBR84813.1 DNA repair protein [Legionella israelensis]
MVLTLGMRHGFDLDHLATIDAISRTTKDSKMLSRLAGILFSLGHGLVVVFISLLVGSGLLRTVVPSWLDDFGQWVSIFFLLSFGFMTIWMLWSQRLNSSIPLGPKSFILNKITNKVSGSFSIIFIGALFALSFDTITQVTLFSISASVMSGWLLSGLLGVVFMLGMMASDGLNGFLVSALIRHADKSSQIIAYSLGLCIAGFNLLLGVWSLLDKL